MPHGCVNLKEFMNNPANIVILSGNKDFFEPLAALSARELGVESVAIATESEIGGRPVSVLITDRVLAGNYRFPVIKVELPVKLSGLFADIQAILESNVSADTLEIGPSWALSLQHKTLANQQSGKTLDLTDKEIQILQIIYTNGGVSREILLKEVWGIDLALDTHTLETHIYRLRKKIRDAFGCEMINAIENGYILDDSVI